MRRGHKSLYRRRAAKLAALVALLGLPIGDAGAALPPDHPGWIRQGGNGASGSTPQAGRALAEVLYNEGRFRLAGAPAPTSPDRWRGWGALRNPDGSARLFLAHGGMNAESWGNYEAAWLRDPDGNDVPFVLGDTVHFGVGFQNKRTDWPAYVIVYWNGGSPTAIGSTLNGDPSVASARLAVSFDGVHWTDDHEIGNHAIQPMITDAAGFNAGMIGATQVILDPSRPDCTAAPSGLFPFDCPISIVYTAISPTGRTTIAAAGAGSYDPLGTLFRGRTAPILEPGGTTWDGGSVDLAKTRFRNEPFGTGFEMTYAGTSSLGGCRSPNVCRIGVASSANRLVWTKNNVARAATEPQLYQSFLGSVTLGPATFNYDSHPDGHARGFIAVHDGSTEGSTWVGLTHPTPNTWQTIEPSKPDNGWYNSSSGELDIFINDDRGANPGIKLGSISVRIDGKTAGEWGLGWTTQPTIVGSFHYLGVRVRAPRVENVFPEGEHILEVTCLDLDGEQGQMTVRFFIDTRAPQTTITEVAPNGVLGLPVPTPLEGAIISTLLDSPVTIRGDTIDTGSGVDSVVATITNVAGLVSRYDSRNPGTGFTIQKVNDKDIRWTWRAPANDPVLLVPGRTEISFQGLDHARNGEQPLGRNTATLIVA